ncbi:hypothetical protein BY458DRAFT_518855 [Sporodiniella umbellata]|nr:hypothetical protein BY458DRAFT_518855 [Sporodiniella umbellata]
MTMIRTTKIVWAICLSTLIFILTLVVYTTSQTVSVQFQVKLQSSPLASPVQGEKEEKFVTYYPHSGLHNQRLALINALVLAKALDRTLIVPETNVGQAVAWNEADRAEHRMSVCPQHFKSERGCFGFRKYVPLPAEAVFDISAARAQGIRVIHRANLSATYFADAWSASESEVFRVRERVRLSYRLFDRRTNRDGLGNFTQRIEMEALALRPERFIVMGSLHYSTRLALSDPKLIWLMDHLREAIGLAHPVVNQQALNVISRLGGPRQFIGVHLRQGDGFFKALMTETIDTVRAGLAQEEIPPMDILQPIDKPPIDRMRPLQATEEAQLKTLQSLPEKLTACLGVQTDTTHPRLRLIYMATDTPQPRLTLQPLFETFPCLFTLADFPDVISQTLSAQPMWTGNALVDEHYERVGTRINSLLIPMLDAEITSHASAFVGTRKSTFTAYILHRLHRFQTLYSS